MNRWVYFLTGLLAGFIAATIYFYGTDQVNAFQPPPFTKTICHHNPSQSVTLTFNTIQAWLGHLGTPHNRETYDRDGACPTPTPTPTPTPPVCETESWSCEACQNDPREYEKRLGACFEPFAHFCNKNYGCEFVGECDAKSLIECQSEWVCKDTCEEPEPTPTPTPTVTPEPETPSTPEGCTENCGVPACTDATPEAAVNPHVYRNGDCAIVKYFPKSGDKVNLYWRENSSNDWQHALSNEAATGSHTICGLGSGDFTFGVQTVNGCQPDGVVNASLISEIIDGDTNGWVLFR